MSNANVERWRYELDLIGASGPLADLEAHLTIAPRGVANADIEYLFELIVDRRRRARAAAQLIGRRAA